MTRTRVVLTDVAMGESARWHEGRFWFSDWGAGEIVRLGDGGAREVVARVDGMPLCFDWLPDGSMVVLDGPRGVLLRRAADGSLSRHADVAGLAGPYPWNDIAVHPRGFAYVNNIGYEYGSPQRRPGSIAVVAPDGTARHAAGDLLFPNGMAVTPDGSTLIVAESHGDRLTAFDIAADGSLGGRRVWAALAPGAAPDGICLDAQGAVWFASVPGRHCVRVREGGAVAAVVELDRGGFDCVLSTREPTLYIVATDFSAVTGGRTGQVLTADVEVAGA